MQCPTCPQPSASVMLPPVPCQGNCNTLIDWTRSYCSSCSANLKKCEHCGKDV